MRALPAALALLALTAPALAGCLGQPAAPLRAAPFAGLTAQGAGVLDAAEGVRAFVWNGTTQAIQPAADPLGLTGQAPALLVNRTFQVDARVGYVGLDLAFDPNQTTLVADLVDGLGRVQCQVIRTDFPATCTVPVPRNASHTQDWRVRVTEQLGAAGQPFELRASLHPASHETHGDPLAGVDRGIAFRTVDTRYDDTAFLEGPRRNEPTVGALRDGSIVAQFGVRTLLSKDDGRTWKDVSPPWAYVEGTHDPMMRVDPWSGGIWAAHIQTGDGDSALSWSLDQGQTWLHNRLTGLPMQDHEKIATGASPLGPASPIPAVYFAYAYFPLTPVSNSGPEGVPLFVATSYDGGLAWVQQPVAGLNDGFEPANVGPMEADRAGNVYLPFPDCAQGGGMGVAVSHDFGLTWASVRVAKDDLNCQESLDPGLAVDAEGTAYLAYNSHGGVKVAASRDHGATWAAPVRVSLPGQRSWAHVDAVGGDAGRLAVLYRATSDSAKTPSIADGWARWDTFVAFVDQAAGASPAVRTAMVNAPDDPVQRGCIWLWGGGAPCRNLLDFVDIQALPDGRVAVVYADGCDGACETPADSRLHQGIVGVETDGPRLFAAKAPWA